MASTTNTKETARMKEKAEVEGVILDAAGYRVVKSDFHRWYFEVDDFGSEDFGTAGAASEAASQHLSARHIRFEYDLTFMGGDYSGVGNFAYVPLRAVIEASVNADSSGDSMLEAFRKHTGIDPVHVVNYTSDEEFSSEGEPIVSM